MSQMVMPPRWAAGTISEVAYRVGFSTPSYFSSSFREYFGMTPKEFVARYTREDADPAELEKLFG